MGIPIAFLTVYLLGGITFLPSLLILVLVHAYLTFPVYDSPSNSDGLFPNSLCDPQDDGQSLRSRSSATSLAEKFHRRHEPDVAAGYFAVCREYVPGGVNGKPPERTTPAGAIVTTESPSVYQSMYRSIFDRRQGPSLDSGKGNGKTTKRARNVFFVVLRHGHLMLYEDSEQMEVKHVISLELHDVGIYGGQEIIPEGELWIKRNAIQLSRKESVEGHSSTSKPFFFFSENCSDKEDFYFALLQNQDVKPDAVNNPPRPQQYETKHIVSLVQKLHSSEEHLQTRWINGLVGRLFLALYKTQLSEDFIRKKITKKIARVKKPAFLSDIVLQKIDMGQSAPHLTNPRLKDLTIDGDCCAEADIKYNGNFRLEIAATARIDLGTRFKAREVNLVLAVVVKKLNGHALVKFKPPPSNRVWISFESMPDLEMTIEPIVSSRQITYGIIIRAIESRIREVIAETVVLPHWDDSPFTDTTQQSYRGGIWADENLQDQSLSEHTKIPDEAPEDETEVDVDTASITHESARTRDERTLSMPALFDQSPSNLTSKAAGSPTQTLLDSAGDGVSSSAQKRTEPPKALRSRSFASAANPLLSMDNANVDFVSTEQTRKQQSDATSAMIAISNRTQSTSPSDAPNGLPIETPTLWENSKITSSKSSINTESNERTIHKPRGQPMDDPGQASLPPIPQGTSSRSTTSASGSEGSQPRSLQADNRNPTTTPEKRQSMVALGAATAAAKNWGWGVISRNANPKVPHGPNQDRPGTPNRPMGRGRPLPPPGQPLPFPEGTRTKTSNSSPPKRKPVAPPALPQRKHEDVNAPLPPLPARKRQALTPVGSSGEEVVLVVQAPPDSESSSFKDDPREDVSRSGVTRPEKELTASSPSVSEAVTRKDGSSMPEERDMDRPQSSHEDDERAPPDKMPATEQEII